MTTSSQGKLTAADISVIAVYIASVIAVGIWVSLSFETSAILVTISYMTHSLSFIFVTEKIVARLSQTLWTTTPKKLYHLNQLSIRCAVWSFNY